MWALVKIMSKGCVRRPEDKKKIDKNWPWPDPKLKIQDKPGREKKNDKN